MNLNLVYNEGLNKHRMWMQRRTFLANDHNKKLLDEHESYSRNMVNNPDWFGGNVTFDELHKITSFTSPELIDQIKQEVEGLLPSDVKSKLKEKQLMFNPYGFGVFSMDRFMMSMNKRPAFFSVSLKAYVAPTEVYENNGLYYLKKDNSSIEVHEKIGTDNKKVYAYFPELPKNSKVIEIAIVAGANARTKAKEMLYTGAAGIIISELCQKAGIKSRISIIIGSNSNMYGDAVAAMIPAKEFNAPIDQNVIALLTSDPRVFRYEMFKSIILTYDYFGRNCPSSLGSLLTEYEINDFYNANPDQKKQHFKSENIIFTSGLFSAKAAVDKIKEAITKISQP